MKIWLFFKLFLIILFLCILTTSFILSLRLRYFEWKTLPKNKEISKLIKKGNKFILSGKLNEALKQYQKVFLFRENNLIASVKITYCLYFLGKFSEAKKVLEKIEFEKLNSNKYLMKDVGLLNEILCKINLDMDNFEKANTLIKILYNSRKFNNNYLRCKAWEFYKKKEYKEAFQLLKKEKFLKIFFYLKLWDEEWNYRKGMILSEINIEDALKTFNNIIDEENEKSENFFVKESKKIITKIEKELRSRNN